MKQLASKDNPLYKQLKKLAASGGERKKQQLSLLEGVHLCEAYLAWQGMPVYAVFCRSRLNDDKPGHAALRVLHAQTDPQCVIELEKGLIDSLESVPAGQGVVFFVSTPDPALPAHIDENTLILDRVQDPGNVGSILRTAAAAGVRRVFLLQGCAAAWSPKVLRSSQGAHFSLLIHENLTWDALASHLRVPVAVTTLEQAQSLYAQPLPAACAWVFGHEGQGVDARIQAEAAHRYWIPQEDAAESLNVAAAAAVCLFEQRRQRLGAA